MIYRKLINSKLITVEFLLGNKEIFKEKQYYLQSNYKDDQLQEVYDKLILNKLNGYFCVTVTHKDNLNFMYQALFKVRDENELIEVLIIYFKNNEEYEICDTLVEMIK